MARLNDVRALQILRDFALYTDGTQTLDAEKHVSRHLNRCIDHHSTRLRLIPVSSFYRILGYPELNCDPDKLKRFIDESLNYNQDFIILYELIPERTIWTKKRICIVAVSILFLAAIPKIYPKLRDSIKKLILNCKRINSLLDLIFESESIHLQSSLAARNSIQINVIEYQRLISELQKENRQLILSNAILSAYIAYLI